MKTQRRRKRCKRCGKNQSVSQYSNGAVCKTCKRIEHAAERENERLEQERLRLLVRSTREMIYKNLAQRMAA